MSVAIGKTVTLAIVLAVTIFAIFANVPTSFAARKGLSQIVTPD